MVLYLTISYVLILINIIFMSKDLSISPTINFDSLRGITLIVITAIFLVALKGLITFISIDDNKVKIGFIFTKSIQMDNIISIQTNESIILKTSNKEALIRVYNFEKNYKKYEDIISCIVSKSNIKRSSEETIQKFDNSQINRLKSDSAKKNEFSVLSKILLFYFISYLFISIVDTAKCIKQLQKNDVISYFNVWSLAIATLIMFVILFIYISKHKLATKTISALLIVEAVIRIVFMYNSGLIYLFANISILKAFDYIRYLVIYLYQLLTCIIILRYMKISENIKNVFINNSFFIDNKAKKSDKKEGLVSKKRIKIYVLIMILFVFVFVVLVFVDMIQYYSEKDNKAYNSIEEILETKYGNYKDKTYIEMDNYYYIILKDEVINIEELVWSYEEGKYVFVNRWNENTKDAKEDYVYLDFDDIFGKIYITKHEENYIILIDRALVKQPIRIFDNYGEWEKISIYGVEYYFHILDVSEISNDYKVYAKTENGNEFLLGAEKLKLLE